MALSDMMGLSDAPDMGSGAPSEEKSEGEGDHYKGFASRLKQALDGGNDARAKMLLRDCIEEVLDERG